MSIHNYLLSLVNNAQLDEAKTYCYCLSPTIPSFDYYELMKNVTSLQSIFPSFKVYKTVNYNCEKRNYPYLSSFSVIFPVTIIEELKDYLNKY